MIALFTALSAVVPSALLLWYFRSRDVHPEPGATLLKTFLLGVLIVVPVLVVALPVAHAIDGAAGDPYVQGALDAFLTAAFPEELFKLVVIAGYCARHKDFDEPMDGVVYGAVASLGFATLENVLYVSDGGIGLALVRALTAVPGHAMSGAIMGYFVGQAKFASSGRSARIVAGYFVAVALHGLYDFPLITMKVFHDRHEEVPGAAAALVLLALATLVLEWVWAVRLTKRLRAEQQRGLAFAAAVSVTATGDAATAGGGLVVSASSQQAAWVVAAAAAPPPPAGSSALAWFLLVVGGLLGSAGGLLALTLALGLVVSPDDAPPPGTVALAFVLFGALPLALGLLLFSRGLGRLRAARPPS
ncbi:MAG TPA: PrsW family glutamic-type intramembrane protease [Myxococcota bacterium]|jgi:RsiW-degrading membrane proteinase PrsW (M82 family)|nr:PrsW family glutamic-type intramembrane protease [Myxococcota bacterium]